MKLLDLTGWTLFLIICGVLLIMYMVIKIIEYFKKWLNKVVDDIGKSVDEAFKEAEMKELEA